MPTPQISKITLPSGQTYFIKDAEARSQIQALVGGDAVVFMGVSTTEITDGGSEVPTIGGETITPATGQLFFYGTEQFVWGPDGTWHGLGSLDSLGALAYKDNASGSYTPEGTVSQPTFSGTSSNVTITATDNANGNYQPKGTVSKPDFTGSNSTFIGTYTPEGTINLLINGTNSAMYSVSSTIEGDAGSEATYIPHGSVSKPTFTGTSFNSTGKFTPAGSISFTNTNKTATVSKAVSGTATYTPEGSVAAPTISVKTAGTTATVKNPTSVTVAKTVVAAAPGATAPSNNLTYYSVTNETLSLYQIGYTTGASITTADVTVKTGDAVYEATAPTFTGTGARLVTDNIAIPTSATFTGTEDNITVSGVATGSISKPTFTGQGTILSTELIPTSTIYTATFVGTEATISTSGTPNGTVSQPTFTGTKAQLSGTTTATGTISQPTFTGTQANITVN